MTILSNLSQAAAARETRCQTSTGKYDGTMARTGQGERGMGVIPGGAEGGEGGRPGAARAALMCSDILTPPAPLPLSLHASIGSC